MSKRRVLRPRTALLAGYLLLLLAAASAVVAGSSMFFLLGVVFVPALVLVRGRVSLAPALALLFVAFVWATLLLFVLARYTHLPPLVLVVVAALATGALCAWRLHRRPLPLSGEDLADLGIVSLGALVWGGVLLAAAVLPDGTPISWAMSGDAANNVLFARSLLEAGGVSLGAGENPVPLTATLIALFTLPGSLSDAPSVADQIQGLAQMWSFGIVAACALSGAFALALLRRRTALGLVAVGVTSLVPLTWMLLSGPIILGFVNFHLTLAILLVPLIVLVRAAPGVLTSFVALCLSIAATLALWAPTVGIPGVALLIVCVVHRRRLLALRRGRLAIALLALAQPAAFFAVQSVPSLIGGGEALNDAIGAVFEFRKLVLVALAALLIVLAVLWTLRMRAPEVVWVTVAVLCGGGACLAMLLWLRRDQESLWSYYQLKLLWFLIAMLAICAVAVGSALAASLEARPALAALALAGTAVGVWTVEGYAQRTLPTFAFDAQAVASPLGRILAGDFFSVGEGDRVYDRIVELTDAPERTILWNSTDPDEDSIMFWVVQMSASSIEDVELRAYAYYHDPSSMDDLCTIRRLIGAPVTVVTHDPDIAERVTEACSELGPVRMD